MTNYTNDERTEAIIGAAMEVINTLGHGLLEKPYENALCVEFDLRNIPFKQQVEYKGIPVGTYIPDILAFDEIVVELKTIDKIGNHELGQMLNYLKITELEVGLIINFKHSKLQRKRVVL